ncbi:unnamed protein product [Cladocopium goreaui]|uniref:Uncharacterized protein n=1 Tax=Cladocopium goreaui TaxID=2562237 RepID=A0A9P1CY76_9DINO|nr:unnamed protein product [Cladocopium goreaui]CAI3999913.1 unnamed protein product [Cladocopium goreaui]
MIGMVILANAVVIGMESQARAWMPLGCSMDCDCKVRAGRASLMRHVAML